MDAELLSIMRSGGRNKAWVEKMVNLEARKLIDTANSLSLSHLKTTQTRMDFVREIRNVVEQQFTLARAARSDKECITCIKNLRAERENLLDQDHLLRMQSAKLYARVEFIRENNKIVGYIISAVHIVVSGMTVVGGALMMTSMTPIGVLAGAILVIDGVNGLSQEIIPRLYGEQYRSEGIFAQGAMESAQFMGFKRESGLAFYHSLTLSASVYSIFGLARRPGAWRLFRWIPTDYYRKIDTISRPTLTMKIVGYGIKAKVIFDLLSTTEK